MMQLTRRFIILAAALAVACSDGAQSVVDGPNPHPTEDVSHPADASMGNDSPLPAVDSSSAPDATVPQDAAVDTGTTPADVNAPLDAGMPASDAPVATSDAMTDAPMVIAGIGVMDMSGPFQCGAQLCSATTVNVSFYEGIPSEMRGITCAPDRTSAELSGIGFTAGDGWANCRGNTCFMDMPSGLIRALVYPMTDGHCGPCGRIVEIRDGHVVERTSGIRDVCMP